MLYVLLQHKAVILLLLLHSLCIILKGTMTSSSSTAIIFGSGTKWKENIIPLAANTQVMTRANNTRVGLMSSQASNTTMNLSANSSVTVTNEEYFVEHITDSMWNLSDVPQAVFGFLTTTYASRQWYANIPAPTSIDQTSRLWFSDQIDFQSVDCQGKRGDYIDIQNRSGGGPSPIVNIQGTPNALLVLKTNVTFAITGKTISSFSAEHVLDDGCIDNATVMPYHDGLIWAGKDGIYIFDGTTVINLLEDKLEKFYTEALASYNPFNATSHNTNRACAVIYRDHYICNINPVTMPSGYIKSSSHYNTY